MILPSQIQNDQAAAILAAQYQIGGYVILPSLLSDTECDTLKQEARRVLREHGSDKATVYVGAAVHSDAFRKLADDPRVIAPLKALMPEGVMFLSDKIVYKSPEKTFATPWHIDAFYWRGTRPKLSVWIPLDDATPANGTLKVLPGSHRQEWDTGNADLETTGGEFGNVVDNPTWEPGDEVACDVPRGSAVIFSDRLLHASCPNTARADRYTIISTYHAPAEDEPFDLGFPARHVVATTAD